MAATIEATFLFSDIEGSSELWDRHAAEMEIALDRHNELTELSVAGHRGRVVRFNGDGVFALFADAADGLRAAVDIQRSLATAAWPTIGRLRVRIGLHTGSCRAIRDDVYGTSVNLAARLHEAAHSDQIVLSGETAAAAGEQIHREFDLAELGLYYFRGVDQPITVSMVVAAGLRTSFPPLRTGHRGYEELPAERVSLIGRDAVVREVEHQLSSERLVTLHGPGGVGKTCTALHVAHRSRRPRDGIRYVDLALVERSSDVADAVLTALRGQRQASESPVEAVARTLRPTQLLLVLDNCEHVQAMVRDLLLVIIDECPQVRCLATSREPVGIPGERRVKLEPLAQPRAGVLGPAEIAAAPAVALFVERARAIDATFRLDGASAPAVAEICKRADGLPLALEMAASCLDAQSLHELAHLGEHLLDRLPMRTGGTRVATVREAIDWAFDRLAPETQELLGELAVFSGSFSRDMAEAIAGRGEIGVHLDEVIRSGLVIVDQEVVGRYRLLELAKSYVRTRDPGDRAALDERHTALMVGRAGRFGPMMRTANEGLAVRELRADLADQRALMHRLIAAHDLDRAAQMLCDCSEFHIFQMIAEAYGWAQTLADRLPSTHPLTTRVLGLAALGAWFAGDLDGAVAHGEAAVAALGDRRPEDAMWARIALVDALAYAGRFDELIGHFAAMVTASRQSEELFWQVNAYAHEAISLAMFGDFARARRRGERAVELARRLGNADCLYWALLSLGLALEQVDPAAAAEAMHGAMDAAASVESRWNMALALEGWVDVQVRLGNLANAADGARDLLQRIVTSGNRSQLSTVLRSVARTLAAAGCHEEAAILQFARTGLPAMPFSQAPKTDDAALDAQLRAAVGPAWDRLAIRSLAMPEHVVVELARQELEALRAAPALNTG